MTIKIRLPWPEPELNPNSRVHWRRKAEVVADAREEAFVLAMNLTSGWKSPEWAKISDKSLSLKTVIFPPDKRKRDQDNVYASLKAARDGFCEALFIDDHSIKRTVIEWGDVVDGGEIVLELEELRNGQ